MFSKSLLKQIELQTLNLCQYSSLVSLIGYRELMDNQTSKGIFHILFLYLFSHCIHVYLHNDDQYPIYPLKTHLGKLIDENHIIGNIVSKLDETMVNDSKVHKNSFERYEKRIQKLCRFIQLFKHDLQDIQINKRINGDCYICNLEMVYPYFIIDLEYESTGIKNLVNLFDYLDFACKEHIVFIDDLDTNMNEIYIDVLIEYFMNDMEGQLCFTTHNSSLMNILKDNKESICFLSSDHTFTTWTTHGNASPENYYREGYIEGLPFNIFPSDFLGIFGDSNPI